MLNATLLEVECKKAPPAGPDGDPDTPKKVNPIELVRVIASFATRRQNLDQAHAKLKSLMKDFAAAPPGKKKDKIEGDIACEKLRVSAAEGWLRFTLKRWEIMSKFVQDNNPMTPKLKGILAFGGEQAKQGATHLDVAGTDKEQPPLLALSFDYKNNTLNGPDGSPYAIPEVGDVVGKQKPKAEPAAAAPEPTPAPAATSEPEPAASTPEPAVSAPEPETDADLDAKDAASAADAKATAAEPTPEPTAPPEPPVIDTIPTEKYAVLKDKAKELVIAALKDGMTYISPSKTMQDMKAEIYPDAVLSLEASNSINSIYHDAINEITVGDADMEQVNSLLASIDIDIAEDGPVYIGRQLSVLVAEKLGKRIPSAMANDMAKAEIAKRTKNAEGYSWDDLSGDESQALIAASQKALAAAAWSSVAAGTKLDPSVAKFAVDTSVIGKKLHPDAMTMAASFAGMALDHNLASLPDDIKSMYSSTAQAAGAAGKDPVAAIIALDQPWVLNADGLAEVKKIASDASAKQPDEVGFLAKIKSVFEAHPHSLGLSYADLASVVKQGTGKSPDELASDFHVKDVAPLSDKINKIGDEVAAKKFDKGGFDAAAFAAWDALADKVKPDWNNAGKFTTLVFDDKALDLKFKLSHRAAKVLGLGDEMSYVYELWKKWKEADDAKGKADAPINTAPTPGAQPIPPPKMVIPGGSSYFGKGQYAHTKQKKIFKEDHLTLNQRLYLRAKIALAIQGGAMYTAAGEIGPKKLGAIAAKIQGEFKSDWADAGVTQLSLDLVKSFLEKGVDLYKSNPSALWAQLPSAPAPEPVSAPVVPEPAEPEPEDEPEPEPESDKVTVWANLHADQQQAVVDFIGALVKQGAPDIQQQVKTKFGYTLTASRISGLIDKAKAQAAAPAAEPVVPPAPPAPPPAPPVPTLEPAAATLQDIPALHAVLAVKNPFAMSDWEKTNVLDIWKKTIGAGKPPSPKQKISLEKFLTKCKKLLPATINMAPVTPAPTAPTTTLEVEPTAPAEVYAAAGVKPGDNPLGMTYEEIEAYVSVEKPGNAPAAPHAGAGWIDGGAFGVDGVHPKSLIGTDANFKIIPGGTFADKDAPFAWMKKQPARLGAAFGEVAANRLQGLLGLPTTKNIWLAGGELIQHFENLPTLKQTGKTKPWAQGNAEAATRSLQKNFLVSWLTQDMDDHNGNMVEMKDGSLMAIDRGQAFKFFDSSMNIVDYFNRKIPKGANLNKERPIPMQALDAWAAGEAVPLMPLSDPEFEDVVARAEAIPSDLYQKMWDGYAAPHVKNGNLCSFSSVPADKTYAGFMTGLDERRKGLRNSVATLYGTLAKARAKALKAKGDARPLAEIEQEVRDQIGLDSFTTPKKVAPSPEIETKAVAEASVTKGTWENMDSLPATSRLPDVAALQKSGHAGIDMMVAGDDVKDGRISFHVLGGTPFVTFMVDSKARARIQAKLPGGANAPVLEQPAAPVVTAFVPPPKPAGISTPEDTHDQVMGVAGHSSTKIVDGKPLSRIARDVFRWAKGIKDTGVNYVAQGLAHAKKMAESSDPYEKAAGQHYVNEFLRIGSDASGTYVLKPFDSIPEEDRKIKPFVPSAALLAAKSETAKAAEAAYAAKVKEAKAAYDAEQAEAQADYEKAVAKYEADKKKLEEEAKKAGKLQATKHKRHQRPAEDKVKKASDKPSGSVKGENKFGDMSSEWDGSWEDVDDGIDIDTWEMNMTDVVTGTAVAGGAISKKKRLLVHYSAGPTTGNRPVAGRAGRVSIQFPEGSTREQMVAHLQAVAGKLGIDLRPAAEKEQELNYLRRMAWLRKIEGYLMPVSITHEPDGSVDEKIEYWLDYFRSPPGMVQSNKKKPGKKKVGASAYQEYESGGVGYDPRYEPERVGTQIKTNEAGEVVYKKNKDGTPKRNPNYQPQAADIGAGRFAFRRFDISDGELDALAKKGAGLEHHAYTPDSLYSILNGGALYSNEKRHSIGFPILGKSPKTDPKTGGSNEVYFYTKSSSAEANLGSQEILLAPHLMAYTAGWSHPQDHYGSKSDSRAASRAATVQEQRRLAETFSNIKGSAESLIGDKVDIYKWAIKIKTGSASMRDDIIAKLKAAGRTHIGYLNKPVEEVIVA